MKGEKNAGLRAGGSGGERETEDKVRGRLARWLREGKIQQDDKGWGGGARRGPR